MKKQPFRDFLRVHQSSLSNFFPESASVVEAMTEGVIACKEDDDIEKAAQIMSSHKTRRLPVMDADGEMTGMVSLGDLAQNLDATQVGKVLKDISQ